MAHTFGPGEYTMRNGEDAAVMFELPSPHTATYPLVGYIKTTEGTYFQADWMATGKYDKDECASRYDLLPPKPLQCRAWMVRWLEDSQIKQDLFSDYEDASQALDDCEADGMAAYIIELTGEVPTGHLLGGGR